MANRTFKVGTTQLALFAPTSPQAIDTNTTYTMSDSRVASNFISLVLVLYTTSTVQANARVTLADAGDAVATDHSITAWVNGTTEEIRYRLSNGSLVFYKLPSTQLYLHRVYARVVT